MFIRKLEIESSILGSQKRFFDEFEGFFTILLLAQSTPPERAASPRVRRGNSRHQQLSEDEIEKLTLPTAEAGGFSVHPLPPAPARSYTMSPSV